MKSDRLHEQEMAVVWGLWNGLAQKEIAESLQVRLGTVHHLLRSAKKRMGAHSTVELLRSCLAAGVLVP